MRFYWDEKSIEAKESGTINLLILTEEKQGKQKAFIRLNLLPEKTLIYPVYFEGVK